MDKAKRAAVIAGNWKMNKTPAETTALINEMKPLVAGADCKVVLCVPFVDIAAAVAAAIAATANQKQDDNPPDVAAEASVIATHKKVPPSFLEFSEL